MKRILTSILILLVLTLSVHPMFTILFCQGSFQSLSMSKLSKNNTCCVTTTESGNNDNLKFQIVELLESDNTCCTYTDVMVVTDDFIVDNISQNIQTPTISTFFPAWFVVNYLINLSHKNTILTTNFNIPIYGSNLKTLDFLSLICVYRL